MAGLQLQLQLPPMESAWLGFVKRMDDEAYRYATTFWWLLVHVRVLAATDFAAFRSIFVDSMDIVQFNALIEQSMNR